MFLQVVETICDSEKRSLSSWDQLRRFQWFGCDSNRLMLVNPFQQVQWIDWHMQGWSCWRIELQVVHLDSLDHMLFWAHIIFHQKQSITFEEKEEEEEEGKHVDDDDDVGMRDDGHQLTPCGPRMEPFHSVKKMSSGSTRPRLTLMSPVPFSLCSSYDNNHINSELAWMSENIGYWKYSWNNHMDWDHHQHHTIKIIQLTTWKYRKEITIH